MKKLILSYDEEAQALYVKLREGKINRTIRERSGVYLDYDHQGKLIGIEILGKLKLTNNLNEQIKTKTNT